MQIEPVGEPTYSRVEAPVPARPAERVDRRRRDGERRRDREEHPPDEQGEEPDEGHVDLRA
jgi:hypothetical protein